MYIYVYIYMYMMDSPVDVNVGSSWVKYTKCWSTNKNNLTHSAGAAECTYCFSVER